MAPYLLPIELKIGELPQSTHTSSSLILDCHLVATIQSNLTKPSMFDEHLLSSYLSEFCTPWALTDARCDPGSKKQGPAHFPYLLRSHAQSCSIGSIFLKHNKLLHFSASKLSVVSHCFYNKAPVPQRILPGVVRSAPW